MTEIKNSKNVQNQNLPSVNLSMPHYFCLAQVALILLLFVSDTYGHEVTKSWVQLRGISEYARLILSGPSCPYSTTVCYTDLRS